MFELVAICWFFMFSSIVASRDLAAIINSDVDVAIGLVVLGGSEGRLGPRSSPLDSRFSATIWGFPAFEPAGMGGT